MAIAAFIIASILGLIAGTASVAVLGMGMLSGVTIYLGLSVTIPLLVLFVTEGGDDADAFALETAGMPPLAA